MRLWLAASGICAVIATLSPPADAQNYPWCADYGSPGGDGGTNCGFTTFQQCLATVSGIGGSCDRNTQYVPSAGPGGEPAARRHRRHYRHHEGD